MTAGEFSSAYLIHSRPYRDSSLLADFFSLEFGMLRAIVKGARGGGRGGRLCQPFGELQVVFAGKGQLKTAHSIEARGLSLRLTGRALFSAMYLNELLLRAIHVEDPHPEIYQAYAQSLCDLAQDRQAEAVLRGFELVLLQDLGYGLDFSSDIVGDALLADGDYQFVPEQGFIKSELDGEDFVYSGEVLAKIAEGDYCSDQVRAAAKALFRNALLPLVGHQPMASRSLFTGKQA